MTVGLPVSTKWPQQLEGNFSFRDVGSTDLKAGPTARLHQIESAADQGRPKKNSVLSDELAKS